MCVCGNKKKKIHEFIDGWRNATLFTSPYAFRLIFNGKILTPLVPGCHPDLELCDINILKSIVMPFARRNMNCNADNRDEPGENAIEQAKTLIKTNEGFSMFLGLLVMGIVLGACGTHVFLTGRLFGARVTTTLTEREFYGTRGLQESFDDEPIVVGL